MEKKFREPSCCRKCKSKGDGVNCMGCKKPLKSKFYFKCEICGGITPKDCEGSEPNTCANCMPLGNDIDVLRKRSVGDMDKLPREYETRPEQSKFCKIWHDMKVGDYCVSLEFDDYRNVIKDLLNKMSKEDLVDLIWENLENKELDEIFQEELKEMYKVGDYE